MHSESDTNMEMIHTAPTRDARRPDAHIPDTERPHTEHDIRAGTNKRGQNENVG